MPVRTPSPGAPLTLEKRVFRVFVATVLTLGAPQLTGMEMRNSEAESTMASPPVSKRKAAADVPRRSCTVTDSNGPLEGGERITHGCRKGEICVCEAQSGYSCSGWCRDDGSGKGADKIP